MKRKNELGFIWVSIIFLLSVSIRTIVGIVYYEAYIYYDELLHIKLSESLFTKGTLIFRGIGKEKEDFLYYLFLLPGFLCKNRVIARNVMIFINSILMSSAIFPVYHLAKRNLKRKIYQLVLCISAIVIPEMCYTGSIVQENLFYPLSLWAVVMIHEYLVDNWSDSRISNLKYPCLLGICAGLLVFTKDVGIIYVFAMVVVLLVDSFIHRDGNGKKSVIRFGITVFSFLFVLLVWELIFHVMINMGENESEFIANLGETVKQAAVEFGRREQVLVIDKVFAVMKQCCSYLLSFIFFTGFLPVLFTISGFSAFSQKDKELIVFVKMVLLGTIVSVCILDINMSNLRIHYRYIFGNSVVFYLFFLKVCENFNIKAIPFLISSCTCSVLYYFISIFPMWNLKNYDSISMRPIWILARPTTYKIFILLLTIFFIIFFLLLIKQKIRRLVPLMVVVVFTFVFGAGVYATVGQYNEIAEIRRNSQFIVADALKMNEYLQENEGMSLLISEEIVSMATFECYFNGGYYLTTLDCVNVENWERGICQVKQTTKLYSIDFSKIRFLISQTPIVEMQKYQVNGILEYYYLYDIGDVRIDRK